MVINTTYGKGDTVHVIVEEATFLGVCECCGQKVLGDSAPMVRKGTVEEVGLRLEKNGEEEQLQESYRVAIDGRGSRFYKVHELYPSEKIALNELSFRKDVLKEE